VCVPAEDHASFDGLDIHMGTSDRSAVIGVVFDHFFMETVVLPPASYRVEFPKIERKSGNVKIGLDPLSQEEILFLLPELFTEEKLE